MFTLSKRNFHFTLRIKTEKNSFNIEVKERKKKNKNPLKECVIKNVEESDSLKKKGVMMGLKAREKCVTRRSLVHSTLSYQFVLRVLLWESFLSVFVSRK